MVPSLITTLARAWMQRLSMSCREYNRQKHEHRSEQSIAKLEPIAFLSEHLIASLPFHIRTVRAIRLWRRHLPIGMAGLRPLLESRIRIRHACFDGLLSASSLGLDSSSR
jgi:hypothetical protein